MNQIVGRNGKGANSRITVLPAVVMAARAQHLHRVSKVARQPRLTTRATTHLPPLCRYGLPQ